MMANRGSALKMYREADDNNRGRESKYSSDALLEIVGLLVRMPWDSQLRTIAADYADKLRAGLLDQTIPSGDAPVAHELLALYFSRTGAKQQANEHALTAELLDNAQVEDALAKALIFLRKTRMSLAACIDGIPAETTWETKGISEPTKVVVTHDYLRRQYYHAWDAALVKTVLFASKQKGMSHPRYRLQKFS